MKTLRKVGGFRHPCPSLMRQQGESGFLGSRDSAIRRLVSNLPYSKTPLYPNNALRIIPWYRDLESHIASEGLADTLVADTTQGPVPPVIDSSLSLMLFH